MPGMTCPHCGAATSYSPIQTTRHGVFSPGNLQRVTITGSTYSGRSHDLTGFPEFFTVCACQACDKPFPVRGATFNSEYPDENLVENTLTPLWPTRYKAVSGEIPESIREAMEDASAAIGAGSVIGGMMAARTAIMRSQRQKKDELGLPESSLKALVNAGLIARMTFEGSDVARRWAGHLGHEEPDPDKQFSKEDAEEVYEFVEALLDELYVKPARIQKHQARLKGQPHSGTQSSA